MENTLDQISPVHIRVRDLAVQIQAASAPWVAIRRRLTSTKHDVEKNDTRFDIILNSVSAEMPPGSLTAIIGASGSGKTTLLNAIAQRTSNQNLNISGSIEFNGNNDLRVVRSAYLMQQDILIPPLSVRESLHYAADLRLPPPSTKDERTAIVEKIILELGLKDCADTRIGHNSQKGCSGGEKRRTSVGVQMLANPSVLFCDEPTSGLDSHTALQIVQILKSLAANGRTIIMAIHAPRSEMWSLFDRVILLSRGYTLYSGPVGQIEGYFKKSGYEIPPFVNPAEFLIDLASIDTRFKKVEQASLVKVFQLKHAWEKRCLSEKSGEINDFSATEFRVTPIESLKGVGFHRQVSVLTRRGLKVALRDRLGVTGSIFEAVIMSIIAGTIFLQLGTDEAGIRSREGALYTASSMQSYLILMFETYRLTLDIRVFDREHREGAVSIPAFLISRRLARLFLEDLAVPVIFSLIFYFMVGFRSEATTFLIFLATMIIEQFITVTLASLCVAVSRDFAKASWVANVAATVQTFACGYFVQSNQIPVYVTWLKWISYNFYIYGAFAANEFIGSGEDPLGQFYDCTFSRDASDPLCSQYRGRYIMDSLGLPANWIWRPIVASSAFIPVFFLGAALILKFYKSDIHILPSLESEERTSGEQDTKAQPSSRVANQITVSLVDYSLSAEKHHLSKKTTRKAILKSVSTNFEPGKLNAIMGPSGSGKTSLLESIAQHHENTLSTSYQSSGAISFNGALISTSLQRSLVSFVTQDDDSLLPALTVRETLRFAAGLRLPSWMSKKRKFQRAEEVMFKLGLKDCASHFVGSELRKGISGGEKRRLSIAVQILTDPSVLVLDEPTSGLDAYTALSVMGVLAALAEEGRTIITTVHQARPEIFRKFDNVLLLASGSAVYSGTGENMLRHVESLGYECPRDKNPADMVVDLIAVDFRSEQMELSSRRTVRNLILEWKTHQPRLSMERSQLMIPAEFDTSTNHFGAAFRLLLQRSVLNIKRTPSIIIARTMQVIGITIIFCLFFAPLHSNQESIQSRMGLVLQIAAFYFIGMLQNIAVYPAERDMFYREHADGCYTALTFIISYTALEIPFELCSSLVFGALTTFVINLKQTPSMFFIASLNCFCLISCGESLGLVFCSIFTHVGFSLNVTCVLISVSTTMGGIMSLNIPGFLQALNYLSPLKYQVANMAAYSMHGQHFDCEVEQMVNGACAITTGEQVLRLYNLDKNARLNLMALCIVTFAYRVIAFAVVAMTRKHWDWAWWKGISQSSPEVFERE